MLSENLADAVRNEFFSLMNTFDNNTTLRDLLREQVAEVCGLMQKNDDSCTDDDGNVYRDEVARHHAEMEKEKRKQANEQMLENSEADLGNKTGSLAIILLSAREGWVEFLEESD